MNTVAVLHNQSLLDIAIQEYGDVRAVIDLAIANELSITDDLTAGKVLQMPTSEFSDIDIVAYYKRKGGCPATAFTQQDREIATGLEGIGYWFIGTDFKVS